MKISAPSLVAKLALFGSANLGQRSLKHSPYKRLIIAIALSLAAGCSLAKPPSIAAHPLKVDNSRLTKSQSGKPQVPATKLLTEVAQAVLQDASKAWGLTANTGKIINAKPIGWAYGCERPTFPYPCDPIVIEGWQVAIASGSQRWVYHTNSNGSLVRLYSRENTASNLQMLPAKAKDAVRNLGAAHLEVSPSQLLFTQVEPQTWRDSCLGLPSPTERCGKVTISGWRVTVEGKPGQRQIYRIDSTGQQIRTEAIAGLPARTDDLPTATARFILKNASDRLKVPTNELYILQAEKRLWSNYCLNLTNLGFNCVQSRLSGWRVSLNGAGRSLIYRIDDAVSQMRIEPAIASQVTQLPR